MHEHRETTARRGATSRRAMVAIGIAGVLAVGAAAPATAGRVHGSTPEGLVTTTSGVVRGGVAGGSRSFAGIPYAAPPVGDLRWTAPRPAKRWTGIRDATRPGSACPQTAGFLGDPPSTTEDCLYLNVTTPRGIGAGRLPVMVWIHGGGFYSGSGGLYGARRLAEQGHVVVVTLNYRLGVFGFLAHPALDHPPGRPGETSGDYGLQDQQAALRWVRDNAAAFGGDARNVTLFGESAGGISVCSHLVSPAFAGLFRRAIIQSGPCTLGGQWPYPDGDWTVRPRRTAERQGEDVAAKLGCTPDTNTPDTNAPGTNAPHARAQAQDTVACLRRTSVSALLGASAGGQGFGPAAGGGVLPLTPEKALAAGRFARVPVIQGTTRDEHRTFVAAIEAFTGHVATDADYRSEVEGFFGAGKAARILAEYPRAAYGSASTALSAVWTDSAWACPALDTDAMLGARVPTYAYEFADENAPWASDGTTPSFPTGAFHASELQYLFDDAQFRTPLSASQRRLSDQMIGYWTTFARTGRPGWPRFAGGVVRSLDTGGGLPVDLAAEHHCGFWRSLG